MLPITKFPPPCSLACKNSAKKKKKKNVPLLLAFERRGQLHSFLSPLSATRSKTPTTQSTKLPPIPENHLRFPSQTKTFTPQTKEQHKQQTVSKRFLLFVLEGPQHKRKHNHEHQSLKNVSFTQKSVRSSCFGCASCRRAQA